MDDQLLPEGFTRLLNEPGGLVQNLRYTYTDVDDPQIVVAFASSSRIDNEGLHQGPLTTKPILTGTGTGVTAAEASIPALAELVERHALSVVDNESLVEASANDLGAEALPVDQIPRCSAKEYDSPACPLKPLLKSARIRWIRGKNLSNDSSVLLPAVMVYTHAGWRYPEERFWLPISTGAAAHTCSKRAILGALLEVLERDALSVTWLQCLKLPEILVDEVGPEAQELWNICLAHSDRLQIRLFDATTDFGIPIIYGVAISRHHPFARVIVGCAAALSYDTAMAKVLKDLIVFKLALRTATKSFNEPYRFTQLADGARYMALPENSHVFDFLLNPTSVRSLEVCLKKSVTPEDALKRIIRSEHPAYVVELTTPQARMAGLVVWKALLPTLQPFSFRPAVQYKANPRLYSLPGSLGYLACEEASLNQWPNPFA